VDVGDVAQVALTLVVGFGAGVLASLLGVGGAVITTPAVRVLGAPPIDAVGSTVPAILPGAVAGTLRYAREGLVDWRAALGLGCSGAVFAVLGALATTLVDARLLMVATAGLMLWSGVTVVRGGDRRSPQPTSVDDLAAGVEASETDVAFIGKSPSGADRPRHHHLGLLAGLGALSGLVAGLLGVGGGIVMVPMLTGPMRAPMRTAVASSLVAVAIFSVPALVTHARLGNIDWSYAVPLMVGVVPGARVGSRITVGASDRTVRLLFGVMILALAVIYGAAELRSLAG
jgi:hypothetical protein